MARLPKPGGDANQWASILNDFLLVAHNTDGTMRPGSVNLNSLLASRTRDRAPVLSTDGTNLKWRKPTEINVRDYGAKGDGVTDDTAAIQTAINDAKYGGAVVFPRGIFMVRSLKISSIGTSLVGNGRWATRISRIKGCTDPMIDLCGTGSYTKHTRYNSIQDLTLSGKDQPGVLLRSYYADNCIIRGVSFISCPSLAVDFAEVWDSRFENCSWENCGSTRQPAVLLRNSTAPGSFGYSTDNTNQIHFTSCRWEGFKNGALKLDGASDGSTNLLNGVFLVSCKMESSMVAGSALQIMHGTTIVYVQNLYLALLKHDQNYKKPVDAIADYGSQVNLSNVYVAWGEAGNLANSTIHAFCGDPHTYRNISAWYPTQPPAVATIVAEKDTAVRVTSTWTNRGNHLSGAVSDSLDGNPNVGMALPIKNSGAFRITSANTGKDLVKADNSTDRPTLHTLNGVDLAGYSGDFVGEKWRFYGDTGFVRLASGNFQVEGTKGYLGIGTSPCTEIAMLVAPKAGSDRGLVIVRPSATATNRLLEFQDEAHNAQGQAFDQAGRPIAVGSPPHIAKGNQVSYAQPHVRVQDIAGNISAAVQAGTTTPGTIATITFSQPFAKPPLAITINDHSIINADLYVSDRSEKGFTVATRRSLGSGSILNFDYIVAA